MIDPAEFREMVLQFRDHILRVLNPESESSQPPPDRDDNEDDDQGVDYSD